MFKIGDVVQVKDGCRNLYYTVHWNTNRDVTIKSSNGHTYCYDYNRLVLVRKAGEFKPGDVVRIKDFCRNTHCTVIYCTPFSAVIKSPTGHSYCYDTNRLVLVSPVPERVGNNAGATPASGSNNTNQQKETDFMPAYTRTSADVLNTDKRIGTKVKRSSLQMYDVFSVNGTTYMHTGVRTAPPSSNGTVIYDPETGRQRKVGGRPVLGYAPNGDEIIGYQSVKLNNVTPGEDGAAVSFNPAANVTYLGRAEIHLPQ